MKDRILQWLRGPRIFTEGVALYDLYGHNRMLKKRFAADYATDILRLILVEELRKLAGISEAELASIRREAYNAPKPVPPEAAPQFARVEAVPVPESVKRVMNFREQFPFLASPDCPDELKILTADMFAAYDRYKDAHNKLALEGENASAEDNLATATAAVENYLNNKQIWAELEHYKKEGVFLGKHPVFARKQQQREIGELSDLELPQKLSNARSNVTRNKKAAEAAETDEKRAESLKKLDYWTDYTADAEAEIEARKKR